ncbi:hypothetical protein NDU88_006422 [Pleurodeles waltl]|uniref:Uncharacterized protein n=1 Tax=Pleurodeles waltl TaxID=8319 RepID=A0AAV7X3P5_PLEWA|nr:hypothetical protein NDU88_006422 [Pleurodeles waltl]
MQHAVKTLDNSAHVPMSARALSRVDSNRHHGTARPQESRDTANGQNNRLLHQTAPSTAPLLSALGTCSLYLQIVVRQMKDRPSTRSVHIETQHT